MVQYPKYKYIARISISKNHKNLNFDEIRNRQNISFQMEITRTNLFPHETIM